VWEAAPNRDEPRFLWPARSVQSRWTGVRATSSPIRFIIGRVTVARSWTPAAPPPPAPVPRHQHAEQSRQQPAADLAATGAGGRRDEM